MTLAETYALQTGLLLNQPFINKKFYPLPTNISKAILIHAGGGNNNFPAKIYDHYNEVVKLLKPIVESRGYKIYQIGGKGEKNLRDVVSLCGITTIHQTAYLLSQAALFIGNDSMNSHIRATFQLPSITLFGPTTAREHGPFWKSNKNILIESHRKGLNPSFSAAEETKTINYISPDFVAREALKLLSIHETINQNTIFIGDSYKDVIMEMVPDHVPNPNFLKELIFTVRMDYLFNEEAIPQIAATRKINIISKAELNIDHIKQYKNNIFGIILEIDENTNIDYVKNVKRTGVKTAVFSRCKDIKKLADLRYKFYDYCSIELYYEKTKENFDESVAEFLNKPLDKKLKIEDTWFKSNKFLLSDGKIFLSKAHYFADKSISSLTENFAPVLDHEDFWLEQDNMLIYTK